MFKILRFISLPAILLGFHFDVEAQEFFLSDFQYEAKTCMPNEEFAQKNIRISEKIILPASILVSSKGNGILEIGKLSLRVYDTHDDTAFYKNGILDIYFRDINGDSCKDLIVWGMNIVTSDKGRYLGMHPLVFVALFNPETKTFRLMLSSPVFDGFTPIPWEDYPFTEFAIPFLWTIRFIAYNTDCNLRDSILVDNGPR